MKILPQTKFDSKKFSKSTKFVYEIRKLLQCVQRENIHNWNRRGTTEILYIEDLTDLQLRDYRFDKEDWWTVTVDWWTVKGE